MYRGEPRPLRHTWEKVAGPATYWAGTTFGKAIFYEHCIIGELSDGHRFVAAVLVLRYDGVGKGGKGAPSCWEWQVVGTVEGAKASDLTRVEASGRESSELEAKHLAECVAELLMDTAKLIDARPAVPPPPPEGLLRDCHELNLHTRKLVTDIVTVGDLANTPGNELFRRPGLGMRSMLRLVLVLERHGMRPSSWRSIFSLVARPRAGPEGSPIRHD